MCMGLQTFQRLIARNIRFIYRKHVECALISFILISILLPLRCPTGRGHHYLKLSEIKDDLVSCKAITEQESHKYCPKLPESLGTFKVAVKTINQTFLSSMVKDSNIQPGGKWSPRTCTSWQRVAIIVPYRDREMQLNIFLQHMHPFLQAQMLDYQIFIVEQVPNTKFNRGKLFNVGFKEASKDSTFCCFILHDVDLLPESPQHIYACSEQPRHMCSALDTFRYVLLYPELFGGAVAFTKDQYELVNGYSNVFYGWGGEDDDLCDRILNKHLEIRRWEPKISRYTMLFHKKAEPNPDRHHLLTSGKERYSTEGLNSLKYELLDIQMRPLYTWLLVDV